MVLIEVTDHEARTRELLKNEISDNATRTIIKKVFRTLYSSALSIDRIVRIGDALFSMVQDPMTVQTELTKMVREGMLRSRMDRRVRLYEVNY